MDSPNLCVLDANILIDLDNEGLLDLGELWHYSN